MWVKGPRGFVRSISYTVWHIHCYVSTTAIASTSLHTTPRYFAVAVFCMRGFQGNGFLPSARELYTSTGSASMSEILDGWKWDPWAGLPARILQWQTCHGIEWLRVFIPVDSYSSQSTPRWAIWRRGFRWGRIDSKRLPRAWRPRAKIQDRRACPAIMAIMRLSKLWVATARVSSFPNLFLPCRMSFCHRIWPGDPDVLALPWMILHAFFQRVDDRLCQDIQMSRSWHNYRFMHNRSTCFITLWLPRAVWCYINIHIQQISFVLSTSAMKKVPIQNIF